MIRIGHLISIACAALLLGNCAADQTTLRDCATKNTARLLGGATILCEVQKQ